MTEPLHKVVDGEILPLTPEEEADYYARIAEAARVTPEMVNAERERRLLLGSEFNDMFNHIYITGDETNRANLSDLVMGAMLRVMSGDTTTITTFRDGNNIDHDLTPPELLALFGQASSYVSLLYQKSWALKAMDPIPTDYTDDSYWQ